METADFGQTGLQFDQLHFHLKPVEYSLAQTIRALWHLSIKSLKRG